MNYRSVYGNLISSRRESKASVFTEKHHILPKSLGGDDTDANIVNLTHREHYVAHLLLAHIHGGTQWLAVRFMAGIARGQNRFNVPSRQYEISCEKSKLSRMGHTVSQDARDKISQKLRGRSLHPDIGKKMGASRIGHVVTLETRAKIGDAHRGRKLSKERREQISLTQKGMVRGPMSDEQKEKLSIAHKGKKLSDDHRNKLSVAKKGKPSPRLGSTLSPETKARISASKRAAHAAKSQAITYGPKAD